MTTRRSHSLLAASVLAAALSMAACASTEVVSAPINVVAAASASPELTTFTKLVQQAGLTATLEGKGPLTVFAPTDEAFKAVPAATLDKLAKDPELLKATLTYHVAPALLRSTDVNGTTAVATLNGGKMTVAKAGDFVTVDDGLVTKADIATGNGVLHVIDRVLTAPKK
jgi:uncharacterized surface protein with fasciclin (FAS1) repeats